MNVLELVRFTIKATITKSEFLKSVTESTEFLKSQKGFISRKTYINNNEWVDCVVWDMLESVKQAADLFASASECKRFIDSIDKVISKEHLIEEYSFFFEPPKLNGYSEKKAFIVCDTRAKSADWSQLYNPEKHYLIIITESDCYDSLEERKQLQYFEKAIKLNGLKYFEMKLAFEEVLLELQAMKISKGNIRILNNDELCMLKSAQLREEFDIIGPKTKEVEPFRLKTKAKERLKALEAYLPKYVKYNSEEYKQNPDKYIDDVSKLLGFPIFAKPIDLAGSVGSSKINNRDELNTWCEKHIDNEFMELDEFINGTLYHCDSFIKDGKILRVDIAAYLYPNAEFISASKPLASLDLLRSDPDWDRIYEFNQQILERLQPPTGTTHLELFKTNEGNLIFLECAARTPGVLIPEMRKISTGIDWNTSHYKLQMGLEVDLIGKAGSYSAYACYPKQNGVLDSQLKPANLASRYTMIWKSRAGDVLKKSEDIADYAYAIMLSNDDFGILQEDFKKLGDIQCYTVKKLVKLVPATQFHKPCLSQSSNPNNTSQSSSSDHDGLQFYYRNLLLG